MENKSFSTKPWYKKWWGVILLILFLPFTITYFVIYKTEWPKNKKIIVLSIFWAIILISSAFQNTSNANTVEIVKSPSRFEGNVDLTAKAQNEEYEKKRAEIKKDLDVKIIANHQEQVKPSNTPAAGKIEYIRAVGFLYDNVKLYNGNGDKKNYVGKIVCFNDSLDDGYGNKFKAVKVEYPDGSQEWKKRDALLNWAWIEKDDAAIKELGGSICAY